jgi:hypothetical protein
MIRDPSDGSVKSAGDARAAGIDRPNAPLRPGSDQNWGLKSLDREARKPKPAPTKEELEAYYATHTLGGKLKEEI